jgi:CheY-like chemotaxis protein
MRKTSAKAEEFFERERDALVFATASDSQVLDLCRSLGDDPNEVAEDVRQLLLCAARATPLVMKSADANVEPLLLPAPGLLPLRRILLVDDDPHRLAARLDEFLRHQVRLGFVVETCNNGIDALSKLQKERFEAILIDLTSPTPELRSTLEKLREWSTPLAPILLNSEGMQVLELRRLNRNAIRALAKGWRRPPPPPYRKHDPGTEVQRKPCQNALFDGSDGKKTGTT